MLNDLALAFRSLRRRPGFAAAAIATLALGIGASTAIFSVAYGIAFRPLPYPNAERLIRIYEAKPAEALFEHDVSVAAFSGVAGRRALDRIRCALRQAGQSHPRRF